MAQPEKRSELIKIRVTPSEKSSLKEIAGPGTIADLFRTILASTEIKPRRVVRICDPRLIFQLNRIGNNLNQLARAVNTSVKYDNPVDAVRLGVALKRIHASVRELINATQDTDGDDA